MEAPKVVVITGASSGVGRATARAFGSLGWCVGLLARGDEALRVTAKEVEGAGGRPLAVVTDVADAVAVERAVLRLAGSLLIEVRVAGGVGALPLEGLIIEFRGLG